MYPLFALQIKYENPTLAKKKKIIIIKHNWYRSHTELNAANRKLHSGEVVIERRKSTSFGFITI
jgi:hypothetical protein